MNAIIKILMLMSGGETGNVLYYNGQELTYNNQTLTYY